MTAASPVMLVFTWASRTRWTGSTGLPWAHTVLVYYNPPKIDLLRASSPFFRLAAFRGEKPERGCRFMPVRNWQRFKPRMSEWDIRFDTTVRWVRQPVRCEKWNAFYTRLGALAAPHGAVCSARPWCHQQITVRNQMNSSCVKNVASKIAGFR